MNSTSIRAAIAGICMGMTLFPAASALAETLLKVDASAPVGAPLTDYVKQGASVAPNGDRLAVNSRYLTRGGKPWFPVMGEFHYTRSAAAQWENELLKMKSSGITVVASYVIWNHHEETEGNFNWTERRDLRHFLQLCKKVGLDAVVRLGPWDHAEVRYGGIPDWVVDAMPTRRNDPQYMVYVERLYDQIGKQLKGLLWKDGGPVIAVQLENEYNLSGPGKGAEHISELKRLARKAGMDVPFYTVTGWDGAQYPPGEVTPVFGGYADEPWSGSTTELPPKETHAFRFDTRVSGDLGAQTVAGGKGTADAEIDKVPFLGAEYGPGIPAMYRRRPLMAPEDIASMIPVQVGSGVNLLGYYMYHGGRNPEGRTWLQESAASGGYNDMPLINYDFQAPLGPDGQQRRVLELLRPYHWFLQDFGPQLAEMTVRKPEVVPASSTDLKAPRFALRSNGNSGFLFVNNYVRQYPMAAQRDVRFSVKLPGETLVFPSRPVTLEDRDYFIWPVNLDLQGTTLRYATAQPLARIDDGEKGLVYVFAAHGKLPVELAFDAAQAQHIKASGGTAREADGKWLVEGIQPGTREVLTITRPNARPVRIVVLDAQQATRVTIEQFAGKRRLLLTEQQVIVKDGQLELRSVGSGAFRVGIFPALAKVPSGSVPLVTEGMDGIFQNLAARLPERQITATASLVREAQPAPPVVIGGIARGAMSPIPEAFGGAASWKITVPRAQLKGLDDALLDIDFAGDVGRLFSGVKMLDDWFYNGQPWQYGLRQVESLLDKPLTLSVMPLRADAPVYIAKEARPDFGGREQVAQLRKVSITPVYLLKVKP